MRIVFQLDQAQFNVLCVNMRSIHDELQKICELLSATEIDPAAVVALTEQLKTSQAALGEVVASVNAASKPISHTTT